MSYTYFELFGARLAQGRKEENIKLELTIK